MIVVLRRTAVVSKAQLLLENGTPVCSCRCCNNSGWPCSIPNPNDGHLPRGKAAQSDPGFVSNWRLARFDPWPEMGQDWLPGDVTDPGKSSNVASGNPLYIHGSADGKMNCT